MMKHAKDGIKTRPLPSSPSQGRLLVCSLRSICHPALILLFHAKKSALMKQLRYRAVGQKTPFSP